MIDQPCAAFDSDTGISQYGQTAHALAQEFLTEASDAEERMIAAFVYAVLDLAHAVRFN